jgi:hypothetical protein
MGWSEIGVSLLGRMNLSGRRSYDVRLPTSGEKREGIRTKIAAQAAKQTVTATRVKRVASIAADGPARSARPGRSMLSAETMVSAIAGFERLTAASDARFMRDDILAIPQVRQQPTGGNDAKHDGRNCCDGPTEVAPPTCHELLLPRCQSAVVLCSNTACGTGLSCSSSALLLYTQEAVRWAHCCRDCALDRGCAAKCPEAAPLGLGVTRSRPTLVHQERQRREESMTGC